MLVLILKIALGIVACVTALLGVSDLKTVHPPAEGNTSSWWRRLTKAGVAKIVFALSTLFLLGLNEWISYSANVKTAAAAKVAADGSLERDNSQERRLSDAQRALAQAIKKIESLAQGNEDLQTVLNKSFVKAGIIRIPTEELGGGYVKLNFEKGAPAVLKDGDLLEWSFSCQGTPSVQDGAHCKRAGYGRLMASGVPIYIRTLTGRRTYSANRSQGEPAFFESAAADRCHSTVDYLKKLNCEMEVTVMREARWMAPYMNRSTFPRDETLDACRRYQALFGESCRDLLGVPR